MPEWSLNLEHFASAYLIPLAWKIAGAIVVWIIGGWLINLIGRVTARGMARQKVDPTLIRYAESVIRVVLRIVLVIAILSVFGIETTSFAALLAAAGIAIGAAWSGLLANFAAGVFLVILRPFRVGDFICAGGVTGEVKEVGLFVTALDTGDNVRTYVGNNKVLGDNLVNYSTNPYRRVDLKAQLAHTVDPDDATARLLARVKQIPNVVVAPEPEIVIQEFGPAGPVLAVRPYCHNSHYWQVYFDTNRAIHEVFAAAGYPVPAPHQDVMSRTAAA